MHCLFHRGLHVAVVCLAAPLSAQDLDEGKFLRKLATQLDRQARYAFDQGFPKQARRVWQEVLQVYDTSAPGMLVFYPVAPLKKGVPIRVAWDLGPGRGGKRDRSDWVFTAK